MKGIVYQLNRKPEIQGERGLPKLAIASAHISYQGVKGDYNHYRKKWKFNTSSRALLIYPKEMYQQLQIEGWPANPGDLGENITTEEIPCESFLLESIWNIGEVQIKISEPCKPCKVLGLLEYIGEKRKVEFVKTLVNRRGWYARVLKEGIINKKDIIERIS